MHLRTIIAAVSLVSTAACASIMNGSNQGLAFSSTPVGAAISVDGQRMGVTPSVLRLARKDTHTVRM